jgi:hypothetical protein
MCSPGSAAEAGAAALGVVPAAEAAGACAGALAGFGAAPVAGAGGADPGETAEVPALPCSPLWPAVWLDAVNGKANSNAAVITVIARRRPLTPSQLRPVRRAEISCCIVMRPSLFDFVCAPNDGSRHAALRRYL